MENADASNVSKYLVILVSCALALGLSLCSLYNFIFFHVMAELFSIIVAASIFVIAWNTRNLTTNPYLLFVGSSYLFIAFIDLIHTLSYKGMGVFAVSGANQSTQLWIAARLLQGLSLLLAPFCIGRKLRTIPVFIGYSIATAILLYLVFSGTFPDAYVEGSGLTPFKIRCEYLVALIITAALVCLWRKKEHFDKTGLRLLTWSMITAIAVEMSFTLYTDVYGFFNFLGHLLKIASYYLIYAAIVKTNLKKPYETLSKEIERRTGLEEELRAYNKELISLSSASSRLNSIGSSEFVYNNICDNAFTLFKLQLVWIGLIQPGSIHVEPIASAGNKQEYLANIKLSWGDEELGRGPAGKAIRNQSPCSMDIDHADFSPWRVEADKHGLREFLGLPLTVGSHCLGVLVMCSSESGFFDESRINRCQIFANNAASICENAQLLEYMVFALGRSSEANDEVTGNHIHRVGNLCALLAEEMGLDDSFVGMIRVQSALHDVGKINTPPELLRKPGKLDDAEFDVIKLHTVNGAEIIGRHPWLNMARNIAIFHHERWDGSGYPHGLKQKDIPLECRIISLADQYDALRSARPYKVALDHDTVCRIILEGDGRTVPSHFDPEVLAAFSRIKHRFNELYGDHEYAWPAEHLVGEISITEDLLTGVTEIDEQHILIASLLNRLNDRQGNQKLDANNFNLMEYFDDYVRQHFAMEERYMTLYKYPLMQAHIMEHQTFSYNFKIMKKQFYLNVFDNNSKNQLKDRLSRWFVDHIRNEDLMLAYYLKTFREDREENEQVLTRQPPSPKVVYSDGQPLYSPTGFPPQT